MSVRGRVRGRVRTPRLSVRTRLTLVYGSLFLVTSAVLVAVMYVLTARTLDQRLPERTAADPQVSAQLRILVAKKDLSQVLALKAEANRQLAQQKHDVLERLLEHPNHRIENRVDNRSRRRRLVTLRNVDVPVDQQVPPADAAERVDERLLIKLQLPDTRRALRSDVFRELEAATRLLERARRHQWVEQGEEASVCLLPHWMPALV